MIRFRTVQVCIVAAFLTGGAARPGPGAPVVYLSSPQFVSLNRREPASYRVGEQVSLAYDSANRPHISYVDARNGFSLKYARWTGSIWEVTPLYDAAGGLPSSDTSIALDPSGNPHIAITGTGYVFRSGGTWQRQTVGVKTASPSIRIGPDGQPRLAYIERTGGTLLVRYAVRSSGGSWTIETVHTMPFQPSVGTGWCSLALDTAGVPNIAYFDTSDRRMKYAYRSGLNWITIIVDSASPTGARNAIAMDGLNRRYIVYVDRSVSSAVSIRIAYQTGSGWAVETVKTHTRSGEPDWWPNKVAVSVAADGTIAVAHDWDGRVWVHRRLGGVWRATEIQLGFQPDRPPFAAAFDASGALGVACCGEGPGESGSLHYYTVTGTGSGVVVAQLVDATPRMGSRVVALSRDGETLVYNNQAMQSLMAHHAPRAPAGSNPLSRDSYDALVTRGPYEDLHADVDRAGNVFYASVYQDGPSGQGRLICPYGEQDWLWTTSFPWPYWIVDQSGDVGRYNSVAAAEGGDVHISYYDGTNGDLKYARRSGGVWSVNVVDSAGNVGWDTSIALNLTGAPRISYYDVTNRDLKFAYLSGSSWVVSTVDSAGDVGEYTSLVYDGSNRPHISYYDRTNRRLKYARGPIGSWTISVVDSGDVGEFSSVAVDQNGNPHIVYYDRGQGDLKYAWFNGTAWDVRRLDSAGDVGRNASIGIRDSVIRICYYDATQGGVKEIWGLVDYTAPTGVTVTDEGEFTRDSTRLSASWSAAADPETGISHYRYAIGTSPTDPLADPVVPWKLVDATVTSVTETGLSLQNGRVYYVYVQARNHAGEWGPVGISNGIRVVAPATRIADAKRLPDGTWVALSGKVASRDASLFFFYIQEPDRSSGILVFSLTGSLPAGDLTMGKLVDVTGVMSARDYDRVIAQPSVRITGTADPPRPLLLRNIEVAGTDFFYVPGPVRSGQKGDPGRRGPNNVGLYVRTTGRVIEHLRPVLFRIDDGSLPGGLLVSHEATWGQPPVGRLVEVFGYPQIDDPSGDGVLYMRGREAWRILD